MPEVLSLHAASILPKSNTLTYHDHPESFQNALELYKQFGFKETDKCFNRYGIDFVIAELFL